MKYSAVKEFLKYFKVLLIYLIAVFIGSFFSLFILLFPNLSSISSSPENFDYMSLINDGNFQVVALLISNAIVIAYMFSRSNERDKFKDLNQISDILIYFLFGMGLNLILSFGIAFFIPADLIESSNETAKILFSGNPLLAVSVASIIVPIAEESIFRGLLLENKFPYILKAKRLKVPVETLLDDKVCFFIAAIIQGILFGLAHGAVIQGIYTCCLGILFAYINKKENSLLPSIFMHSGLNFFSSMNACYENTNLTITTISLAFLGTILYSVKTFKFKK